MSLPLVLVPPAPSPSITITADELKVGEHRISLQTIAPEEFSLLPLPWGWKGLVLHVLTLQDSRAGVEIGPIVRSLIAMGAQIKDNADEFAPVASAAASTLTFFGLGAHCRLPVELLIAHNLRLMSKLGSP